MSDRVVVVTGGNRGLGLEVCRRLAADGYRVVLTSRSQQAAVDAAKVLAADGLEVTPRVVDVSSDESVESFFAELMNNEGRIDVLVNNAGVVLEKQVSSAGDVSTQTMLDAFNTNALGTFRMTRRALALMKQGGYGRVVNVSTGMASLSDMDGGWPAYRASKAALNALTRVFHAEAGARVKVNSVCPGWVRTEMGGASATRSIPEGAEGIVWAAKLPDDGPSGGFFRDGKPISF